MTEQLYQFQIKEDHGEQEYIDDVYVVAEDLAAATEFAMQYTAEYYEDAAPVDAEKGDWCFAEGDRSWCIYTWPHPSPTLIAHRAGGELITLPVHYDPAQVVVD